MIQTTPAWRNGQRAWLLRNLHPYVHSSLSEQPGDCGFKSHRRNNTNDTFFLCSIMRRVAYKSSSISWSTVSSTYSGSSNESNVGSLDENLGLYFALLDAGNRMTGGVFCSDSVLQHSAHTHATMLAAHATDSTTARTSAVTLTVGPLFITSVVNNISVLLTCAIALLLCLWVFSTKRPAKGWCCGTLERRVAGFSKSRFLC